jgi:hypothetical protein
VLLAALKNALHACLTVPLFVESGNFLGRAIHNHIHLSEQVIEGAGDWDSGCFHFRPQWLGRVV